MDPGNMMNQALGLAQQHLSGGSWDRLQEGLAKMDIGKLMNMQDAHADQSGQNVLRRHAVNPSIADKARRLAKSLKGRLLRKVQPVERVKQVAEAKEVSLALGDLTTAYAKRPGSQFTATELRNVFNMVRNLGSRGQKDMLLKIAKGAAEGKDEGAVDEVLGFINAACKDPVLQQVVPETLAISVIEAKAKAAMPAVKDILLHSGLPAFRTEAQVEEFLTRLFDETPMVRVSVTVMLAQMPDNVFEPLRSAIFGPIGQDIHNPDIGMAELHDKMGVVRLFQDAHGVKHTFKKRQVGTKKLLLEEVPNHRLVRN